MFIAVKQTISEDSIRSQDPEGYMFDDPWEVAKEVAERLRRQYLAWLESTFPDAMVEVDQVSVGNALETSEVKVLVFRNGRNDSSIKEQIQPVLKTINSAFDMIEISQSHLVAKAG